MSLRRKSATALLLAIFVAGLALAAPAPEKAKPAAQPSAKAGKQSGAAAKTASPSSFTIRSRIGSPPTQSQR